MKTVPTSGVGQGVKTNNVTYHTNKNHYGLVMSLFTLYAVGDAGNQSATNNVVYDGVTQTGITTAVDNGVDFNQFTFTKVAGVDEISINSVGETQFHAVNGFSVTGTHDAAVPEPSPFSILALGGLLGLVRRRR